MSYLDYDQIQRVLATARPMAELAEAHGTLAGALCAAPEYRLEDWIGEILPEGPAEPAVISTLNEIFLATGNALAEQAMEFQLLVPDDEETIAQRAVALGAWCQGFLYGLGSSRLEDLSTLPGEAGEIVRDLMEITRVGVDVHDSDESNERAYAELVEFVRVGVQLLFEDLAPLREPRARTIPARVALMAASAAPRKAKRPSASRVVRRDEFKQRRRALMKLMGRDSIAILPAAPVRTRNNDVQYEFRQDSDFYYMTGFNEPESVAVLVPGRPQAEYVLFVRDRDPARETWDGRRAGPDGATRQHGADDAFPISDIDEILPGLLENRAKVFYAMGVHPEFDQRVVGWVNGLRATARIGKHPPQELVALDHVLHDMRLFKGRAELELMRTAARIGVAAHLRAMRACRPGKFEFEIMAELIHEFRRHNADISTIRSWAAARTGAFSTITRMKPCCATAICCSSTPAANTAITPRTSPARFRSTAASHLPSARSMTSCWRRIWRRLRASGQVTTGTNHTKAAVRVVTQGLMRVGLLKGKQAVLERTVLIASFSCIALGTGSVWTSTTSATTKSAMPGEFSSQAWC